MITQMTAYGIGTACPSRMTRQRVLADVAHE
jgi:hypothetical protein